MSHICNLYVVRFSVVVVVAVILRFLPISKFKNVLGRMAF